MRKARQVAYAVKTELAEPSAPAFVLGDQKTMYGGKVIAAGDEVFVFASENHGGSGLAAMGIVTSVRATPGQPGLGRQTPRVSIHVERTGLARRSLGRAELRRFVSWQDARPETELNFKLYRQATDKIVGITAATAAFLREHF